MKNSIKQLVTPSNQKVQLQNLPKSQIIKKGKIIIQSYEYDEENLIGEGATSKVYLGRKCKNHMFLTAIKVVDKRKISKYKQNLDLLKQEIEIHRDLDHPNIVKCYQIIEKNNHYYFMLEYCPDGNLDSFIKKFQYLSESVTTNILEQIISGYKYLMKHKIIHRDLKPPNILKSGYVWKICDFGFSVKGKKNLIVELNVGTPSYMAPQSLQRNFYSSKTDFFSFGVICYEMLFGIPPWQHKNQKILLQMMLQQKINSQKLATITNKNLESFIFKCCQLNQRKRITLEQFQEFDFWKIMPEIHQQKIKPSKSKPFHRIQSQFDSTNVSKQSNLSTIKASKQQSPEEILKKNELIVDKQLIFIKIIYQILKNIRQLSFADHDDKQIFITILHRHSLHNIRRIKQAKFNHLCLKKWQQYIDSTSYSRQLQQVNQLLYKLQNIIKGQTRRKSIIAIRIINRQYDELIYDKMLSSRCVNNIKQYIVDFIDRNVKDGAKMYSNYKKWVIHFLMEYYRHLNTYFCKSQTNDPRQTTQECNLYKIEENYEDKIYSQESFNKIMQELKYLKP